MNEKLQFSWGHIIAFLALIAVGYISFMGFTYLTNGNFRISFIGLAVTVLFYIIFFIGAQQMKASGEKMKKKIIWERIFIFGSPLIFILGMISMSHFWTVKSQNDEIVNTFTSSINNAKKLFSDYETYSINRITAYEDGLNDIIKNKSTDQKSFKNAGFEEDKANIQKENMVETLRLQLLSQNYDALKNSAIKWIDNASQGASTWNVFLLGNTQEIKEAIKNWESELKTFSSKQLTNETIATGEVTIFTSNGAEEAIEGIDGLTSSFTTQKFPSVFAIIFGVLLYFMLLFPYFIQERHSKSSYKNFITKKNSFNKINIKEETSNINNTPHRGTFRLD